MNFLNYETTQFVLWCKQCILCLFSYSAVQHILCCFFVLFFFVLCTLGCQFCLDCPSVLSSIYSPCDSIKPCNNNGKWRVSLMLITPLVVSNCYIGEKMSINVLLVRLCRIISSGSNIISRSLQSSGTEIALSHISKKYSLFIRPSGDGAVLCDWVWRAGGGYKERKLSCGNDPVVKNYIYSNGDLDLWPNYPKINRVCTFHRGIMWLSLLKIRFTFPHDNFKSVYWIFNKLGHMIPLWKG
jgi:hypothetical protein